MICERHPWCRSGRTVDAVSKRHGQNDLTRLVRNLQTYAIGDPILEFWFVQNLSNASNNLSVQVVKAYSFLVSKHRPAMLDMKEVAPHRTWMLSFVGKRVSTSVFGTWVRGLSFPPSYAGCASLVCRQLSEQWF